MMNGRFSVGIINKLRNSTLLRSSLIFTISNSLNSAIPFFLIPVLTRYLSPSDYGIVSIFQVLAAMLVSFTGLNTHNSVIVQYYKKEEVDFPVYVYNALIILILSTLFLFLFFFIFSGRISEITDFPKEWLPITVVFASSQFLFQLLLGLWIATEKPIAYGIFQVSQTGLNLLLSLILVIPFSLGWKGRVLAQIIIFIIYAFISLYILIRKKFIKVEFNRGYVKKALKFGIPLIPHTFGGAVLMLSDRLLISNLIGVAEVGIYMVGFQFAQIILLIQDSVNNAFAPWLYKNLKTSTYENKIRLVRVTYQYMVGIVLFSIIYSLLIPPIYRFFVGSNFIEGERYIFWIALGFAFNGMYKMVVNYIFFVEKTYLLAIITSVSAVMNIIMTYFFVSYTGPIGAAYSLCLSYLIGFLLTWYFSNKAYPMPWGLGNRNEKHLD